MVLRTFNASGRGEAGVSFEKLALPFLRKFLKLKKIPEYEEKGDIYLWTKEYVSIIVLGIREDGEIIGKYIDDKGWKHERL